MDRNTRNIESAISFMGEHYSRAIDLNVLAKAACMSPYHFSRTFRSQTGLAPMAYLKKIRLEKARAQLAEGEGNISEAAYACGFRSISNFNASFKKVYGVSPGGYRKREMSKKQEGLGKEGEEKEARESHTVRNSLLRRIWNMNVTVKDFPEYRIAYFRHTGSYLETGENWNRLLEWVGRRDLFKTNPLFIGISHDDPALTEEEDCRHDACVTMSESFEIQDDGSGVLFGVIPPGKYAVYKFYDTIDKLALAYKSLFDRWLPESEWEWDDRPCLEINLNNPAEDPEGKGRCDICIPVK